MSSWRGIGLCVLCIAVCGCEEPTVMVPAAPPGTEIPPPPPDDKDRAEALGEAVVKGRGPAAKPKTDLVPAPPTEKGETKTTKSGVKYETLAAGSGREAKPGDTVRVLYTGTLENGQQFDSRRDKGNPFSFVIGAGGVIQGWDEGVAGMLTGERRKLTIPPAAAYGEVGKGEIPPNSTLIFDIELLGVDKNQPD